MSNELDILLCDIINLSSDVGKLVESIDRHNIPDVKTVIGKINNVRGRIRQTVSSIGNIRKHNKQFGRLDINKAVNELSNELNDFKVSIINLLYCMETSKNAEYTISRIVSDSKKFMSNLDKVLNKLAFPSNIKNKIVHYQNAEVKAQLRDVPNRAYFKHVFNENHHSNGGPNFNKKGDWYHDGILTHWDGEKFEDIYLRPNGRKLSCGFLVQDEITGKYLGCHPTGQPKGVYDIPKGCKNVGADDLETAVRELKEETGIEIDVTNENIEDLGIHNQKKDKDVHLFKVVIPIDFDGLHCDSTFIDIRDGKKKPEMDGYELLDNISPFLYSIQPIVRIGIK